MKPPYALLLLVAATIAYGQIDNPPTSVNIVDATATGRAVLTATNAAAAASAIGLGTSNSVFFSAVEVGEGDSLYLYGSGVDSLGFGGELNFEERRLSQDGSPIFDWGSGFTVTPAATFSTNVTINGNLSVGSFTTTTPSTWALDATETAADTNGILALPSNANVIRLTNNNAISGVSGGVLGAFYYLVNQTTNAVTISNVGGITVQGGTPLTLGANQAATLVATGATNASVAARGDLNDVTLGGTLNKAPLQTADSADSLMTRGLSDARYLPTFGEFMDGTYYYQTMTDWMNTRTTNGGTATFSTTQSRWSFGSGTNTNSVGGIRLGVMESYENQSNTGANKTWNSPFTVYLNGSFYGNPNGLVRFVVGGRTTSAIGEYPTNRAVGIEFSHPTDVNGTQLIRLIAHNGTTSTNGPWITNFPTFPFVYLLTYGVRYNTNGNVELYRSVNRGAFTNVASANIGGGPTNNPSGVTWGAVDIAAENTDGLGNSGRVQWWGYRYE